MAYIKIMAKPVVRTERKKRGISQERMAGLIGYTTSAYGKIELGRNGAGPRGVEGIISILNMPFEDLFEVID